MKYLSGLKQKEKGFSLIEILVAVVISSIGLLSLGVFQSNLLKTSAESKAKIEAGIVCQAEMEKYREYTLTTAGNVETSVTNWYDNQNTITSPHPGNNASYAITRTIDIDLNNDGDLDAGETDISDAALLAMSVANTEVAQINLNLNCSWTDSNGTSESVTLSSLVTFIDPSSVTNYEAKKAESDIPSPTGRAHLGEGTIADYPGAAEVPGGDKRDRTKTYTDGTDVFLVDTDNNEVDEGGNAIIPIVLTLEKACATDTGICTDFVEINGRIYLNRGDGSNQYDTNRLFDEIFVKASDAAYCKLWSDNTGVDTSLNTKFIDLDGDGTASGDQYEFVNYTCYLGGGWYGNIGVVIPGGTSDLTTKDKICMGDPNYTNKVNPDLSYPDPYVYDYDAHLANRSLDHDLNYERVTEDYKTTEPAIAIRRAYRGLKYKVVQDADYNWVEERDSESNINYYSVGIKDASKLHNQDFLLIYEDGTDGSICFDAADTTSPLIRSDSENYRYPNTDNSVNSLVVNKKGLLFANMPGDFVCLNNYIDGDGYTDRTSGSEVTPYIDYQLDADGNPLEISGGVNYSVKIDGSLLVSSQSDGILDYEQLYATATFTSDAGPIALERDINQNGDGTVDYKDVDSVRDQLRLPPPIDIDLRAIDSLDTTIIPNFASIPNPTDADADAVVGLNPQDDGRNNFEYSYADTPLSDFDEKKYRAETICRYDPTRPVITYSIVGDISGITVTPATEATYNEDGSINVAAAVSNPYIITSSGEVCVLTASESGGNYSCPAYAHVSVESNEEVAQGWTGTIISTADDSLVCTPSPQDIVIPPGDPDITTYSEYEGVPFDVACGDTLDITGTIAFEAGLDTTAITAITLAGNACDIVTDDETSTTTYSCTSPIFASDLPAGTVLQVEMIQSVIACGIATINPVETYTFVNTGSPKYSLTDFTYDGTTGSEDIVNNIGIYSGEVCPLIW